jgi:HSP20 family protein
MTNSTLKPRWSMVFPKPFDFVQREMEQMLGHVAGGESAGRSWRAPVSLWEEENRWCVEMDIPGVKQEDLDVTLDKNTLRITAERKPGEGDRKYWHEERGFGQIERLINLPETVDSDAIEAQLKDGVLLVTIGKKPEAQPRKISIKGA